MKYKFQGIFRFILAIMVLWSHTFTIFFPNFSFFKHLQLGNVAVASFFVLSGYLMHSAIKYIYIDNLNNFILNRYIRISPPFLIAAVFSIFTHYLLNTLSLNIFNGEYFILYKSIFTIPNISYSIFAPFFPIGGFISRMFFGEYNYVFVGYSWAIYTELIFYWFIWMYFKSGFLRFNTVIKFLIITVVLILSLLSLIPVNYTNLDPIFFKKINLFQWTPHFLLGVILVKKTILKFNIQALLLFLYSIIQIGVYAKNDYLYVTSLYILVNIIGFHLINSEKVTYKILDFEITKKIDKYFGNLSYPIYLNHYALTLFFFSTFLKYYTLNTILFNLFLFIIFNFLSILISFYLIKLTDYYTDSIRDRIRGFKFN